ncbi:hypothetical protein HMPREF9997_00462 [Corynebacterium durum F0235]|uniref:Uncharacterized protein n=1 Tax=Corynebacterium durum F0235 TaxID=1035195 RepID=L1MLL0_9CORY|nr:hypothetical protein HMPREF9997_00462 [Corynebacterium durum F0235]
MFCGADVEQVHPQLQQSLFFELRDGLTYVPNPLQPDTVVWPTSCQGSTSVMHADRPVQNNKYPPRPQTTGDTEK